MAIDDCSSVLYAAILPDKTQQSAATFLEQGIKECRYTLESAYSDNGTAERAIKVLGDMVACRDWVCFKSASARGAGPLDQLL